jgi:hypothetical protein
MLGPHLGGQTGPSTSTFTLTIGPEGMRFTVTASEEARDVVTAVYGTSTATTPKPEAACNRSLGTGLPPR